MILCGDEVWTRLLRAYDINDNGWIVGQGERLVIDGSANYGVIVRAFLLIPIDDSTCPADLNLDGAVDVLDLLALLGAWGPCTDPCGCPADLDDSGAVDVQDLLFLLGKTGGKPGHFPVCALNRMVVRAFCPYDPWRLLRAECPCHRSKDLAVRG